MTNIETLRDYENLIESSVPIVIMFSSDYCQDCFYAEQFIPRLEAIYKDVKFYRLKRETIPSLAIDLSIFGVPSFLIYQQSRLLNSWIDKQRKSFEEVFMFIQDTLSKEAI